jgi:hypothetical protein
MRFDCKSVELEASPVEDSKLGTVYWLTGATVLGLAVGSVDVGQIQHIAWLKTG